MSGTLVIDPLTRIEGVGRVKIDVEGGAVKDLQFSTMVSPRFFEYLLLNKPAEEAPRISERICGICYVNHHLVSVKAVEDAWSVEVPQVATMLRRLINAGSFVTSHSLHLAFLALPDLMDLKDRSFIGVAKADPDLAKIALQIHEYGNRVVTEIGGRLVHPVTAVPGGMTKGLTGEARYKLLTEGRIALNNAKRCADFILGLYERRRDDPLEYMTDKTNYMGLVRDGGHELYHGNVRVKGPDGGLLHEFEPHDYRKYWEEKASDHSYTKIPYLKSKGYPEGVGRVGPLARFNVMDSLPWPESKEYLNAYDEIFGRPCDDAAAYHLARAVELVSAVEECIQNLSDDQIVSQETRVPVKMREGEGVGIVEAPRGLLLHNYRVDGNGLLKYVNIIAPTTFNHPIIERNLRRSAEAHVKEFTDAKRRDAALWRLEKIVRAYDPCLSCSVHMIDVDLTVDGKAVETVPGGPKR
jgi:F420-non-reducing hydrogenase large subunit